MKKRRIVLLLGIFLCLAGAVTALLLWPKPLRPLTVELLNQIQGMTAPEVAEFLGGLPRNRGDKLKFKNRSNVQAVSFGDTSVPLVWNEWATDSKAIVVGFDNSAQIRMMLYCEFSETPWQMIQRLLHLD